MTLIDQIVSEGIASNIFHAAHMLNVLKCGELKTDTERLERCKLYNAWKKAKENKVEARRRAIAGDKAPVELFDTYKQETE